MTFLNYICLMGKRVAIISTKTIGKTHIGTEHRFPKEGGYSKHNNFKDDDIIAYSTLCGISSKNFEKDIEEIENIDTDFICFRCLKIYKRFNLK